MKALRILVMLLIFAGMASINPADAQFKKLRKKAKEKIEEKADDKKDEKARVIDRKADEKLDDAVEGAEDRAQDAASSIFERKAQEAMANMMGEAEEPFDLGMNKTGDPDAPFVMYRSVTRLNFAGMDQMPEMIRRFMVVNETHYLHDGRHRTDTRNTSNIADARGERIIHLNHDASEYWIQTFDQLAQTLEDMNTASDDDTSESSDMADPSDMKLTVTETDDEKVVNGASAKRKIMVIESDYTATDDDEVREGKMFIVISAWISAVISGHETVAETNSEIAKAMGGAFTASGNAFAGFFQMMQQDPELSDQMSEALAEAKKMGGGLPVETDAYIVQAPKDHTLDLELVLSDQMASSEHLAAINEGGGEVNSQQTIMKVNTVVGDLATDSFSLGLLDAPDDYTETEPYTNPMQQQGFAMPGGN